MRIGSKSQSSLEYLLVMGIAIFILAAAISYALYYQVGYNSAGTSEDLQLAATSIANAVNSLSGEGIGSSQQFSFSSPGLNLISSICNTSVSLSFGGEEASQSLSLNTNGELPISSGTYVGNVKLVKENGKPEAQIMMDLPISYISTSYVFNPSSVFYNVSFLDTNGNLVGDVNFTLIIYNHNKIIAEQNESTLTGFYSGSITPNAGGQFLLGSTAEIYVSSLNIISPSCFLPQQLLIIPTNVINYVPLAIKNSQSTATSSSFQQEVVVDSANYQQYEASNLQNVEFFYPNGTIINSWLESGNSNTATNSIYWLKLSGIPASSSITIYMGFAPKSVNLFNNINDGEAPQLSSTYGEYDDGANVFNVYSNFAGTSLPSDFTSYVGDATLSVDNGLNIQVANNGCSSTWAGIIYNNPVNAADSIVETYSSGTRVAGPEDVGLYTGNSDSAAGYAGVADTWGWGYGGIDYGYGNIGNPFDISSGSGVASIYWIGNGDEGIGWNYNFISSTNTNEKWNSNLYAAIQTGECSPGADMEYYWFRVRAYPPNGIMPSVTFGPVQPQITVFVNGVKDGNNGIALGSLTNISAVGTAYSHIGLMINGSVVVPLGSSTLSYTKQLTAGLYNITVFSNQSNLANQTYWEAVANIPNNVKDFVPISITNLQSSATSNPFQDNLSIDSFEYNDFENQSLSNVEFFSPSGNIIPSWIQSGDLAYFNGVNSYANLSENYPFSMSSSFTVSVWFKTTSDGTVLWNGNSEQANSSGTYSPIIYVNTNGDLAGGDWVGNQPFDTNYFVANGKWTYVTLVQTPSQQTLYINGTEVATYSGSPQSASPTYWIIGDGHTTSWDYAPKGMFDFKGYITNVQFYNQVFTSSKVALLYDEGLAGSPLNNSGLIAWYMLSGNGNEQNGHNNLAINNTQFNGVASASSLTSYWLKLGSIQPRESYIAFMGFALPNISLFNDVNDGEAPQLSSTYGEYDDGANVFNFYDNFAGTTLNTNKWSVSSGLTYSVDNGISLTGSSQCGSGLESTVTFSSPVIVEGYGRMGSDTSTATGCYISGIGIWYTSGGQITNGWATDSVQKFGINGWTGSSSFWSSEDNPQPNVGNNYVWGLSYVSPSSALGYINYQQVSSTSTPISTSGSLTAVIDLQDDNVFDINLTWYRVRAYPPNGIMPIENVGFLNGQAS